MVIVPLSVSFRFFRDYPECIYKKVFMYTKVSTTFTNKLAFSIINLFHQCLK